METLRVANNHKTSTRVRFFVAPGRRIVTLSPLCRNLPPKMTFSETQTSPRLQKLTVNAIFNRKLSNPIPECSG